MGSARQRSTASGSAMRARAVLAASAGGRLWANFRSAASLAMSGDGRVGATEPRRRRSAAEVPAGTRSHRLSGGVSLPSRAASSALAQYQQPVVHTSLPWSASRISPGARPASTSRSTASSMTTHEDAALLLVSQIRIDRADLGHGHGIGAFPDHRIDRSSFVGRQ